MRIVSAPARLLFALVLTLALAVRLLTPAGFMPAFDRGAVTIVACPDAAAPMPAHHHRSGESAHQPCPYASAVSLGTVDPGPFASLVAAVFAVMLLPGWTAPFAARAALRERPPLRGPPLP